jgi:ribose transport system substrate-binding protein
MSFYMPYLPLHTRGPQLHRDIHAASHSLQRELSSIKGVNMMNHPFLQGKRTKHRRMPTLFTALFPILLILLAGCGSTSSSQSTTSSSSANDPFVAQAKAAVAAATARVNTWNGPTSGPKAQKGKFVVYVSADQTNGGVSEVGTAVEVAAKVLGWRVKVIDGQGTVAKQTDAMSQAIALKPDGIILGGFDAQSQKTQITKASSLGIKIVGWHSAASPGPIQNPPVFTVVESDPLQTAKLAADYAIATTNGTAGVVIFTDSEYSIAVTKSTAMRTEIQHCKGCSVLSYEDTPLADVATRMPPLMTSLVQKYGSKFNYALGINDLYFDFTAPALRSLNIKQSGPPQFVSAGDGSASAYSRIRQGQYQVATIPEPLSLQGWQSIDELNRAFAGMQPSGYVTPVHLVINDNISYDGGPKNIFDPGNNYQQRYKTIWGL